ncbi:MAG: hypothetical protein M1483_00635 [Actinobacteria bacterium]|nr:hypothetical protein [Actinomycetota bacterium]MCL6104140.1 hypothetical protein [Actinomycetota bacterium]
MPTKIEIELTSRKKDGSFTWRAAKARQPKGIVAAAMLEDNAKVGDLFVANAEVGLDGITLVGIVPFQGKRPFKEQLEIIGKDEDKPLKQPNPSDKGRDEVNDKTGIKVGKSNRNKGNRKTTPKPPNVRHNSSKRASSATTQRSDRHTQADFIYKRTNQMLASLSLLEREIAKHLLSGGMPALRKAIEIHNVKPSSNIPPELPEEHLVAIAESLLPNLNMLRWIDRAEFVTNNPNQASLRDLKTLMASSSDLKDEYAVTLVPQILTLLKNKIEKVQIEWNENIENLIDQGDVLQAIIQASTPPEPRLRISATTAVKLSQAVGACMNPQTEVEQWNKLFKAALVSPVRRIIKPVGLPENAPRDLLNSAHMAAGQMPALAALLNIPIPPPPSKSHIKRNTERTTSS